MKQAGVAPAVGGAAIGGDVGGAVGGKVTRVVLGTLVGLGAVVAWVVCVDLAVPEPPPHTPRKTAAPARRTPTARISPPFRPLRSLERGSKRCITGLLAGLPTVDIRSRLAALGTACQSARANRAFGQHTASPKFVRRFAISKTASRLIGSR